jgi:hypothetical protein
MPKLLSSQQYIYLLQYDWKKPVIEIFYACFRIPSVSSVQFRHWHGLLDIFIIEIYSSEVIIIKTKVLFPQI